MSQTIYAIIPARQGSKGVPNKNIRLLDGHPLIAYSIAAAKMTPEITRVIVSTDSKEYADIAIRYGAEAPFLRPAEISKDKSSDLEMFDHCLSWFKENEGSIPKFMVHLRPTTPLREPRHISEAIQKINRSGEATSLRSAHLSPESPLKWFRMNPEGFFTTLSGEADVESLNRPRQEFPDVFVPDGYVDIIRSEFVGLERRLHGSKVLSFQSPYCVEVDSLDEFEFLEYSLRRAPSPLKKYLDELKS